MDDDLDLRLALGDNVGLTGFVDNFDCFSAGADDSPRLLSAEAMSFPGWRAGWKGERASERRCLDTSQVPSGAVVVSPG